MAEWKELWKKRKASPIGKSSLDQKISEQVLVHKRQKTETKAIAIGVSLPSSGLPMDMQAKQTEVQSKLAVAGFFDDLPEGVVSDHSGSEVHACTTGLQLSCPEEKSSAVNNEVQISQAVPGDVSAGRTLKPRQQQKSDQSQTSALPEGFFDNRQQDAKARNAMQAYRTQMVEEMEKLQHKIAEELENQYEAHQKTAQAWTTLREMDELRDMAEAHERLEAIRIRLENFQKAENSKSKEGNHPPTEDLSIGDSDTDIDAELDEYDWRLKSSSKRKFANQWTLANSEAPKEEEGDNDNASEDDNGEENLHALLASINEVQGRAQASS